MIVVEFLPRFANTAMIAMIANMTTPMIISVLEFIVDVVVLVLVVVVELPVVAAGADVTV
jgi:hypothetical protein